MVRRRSQFGFLAVMTLAIAVTVQGNAAWCQTTTIKIVVPLSPGGAVDIVARLLATQMGSTQGATVTVENRPGANGAIGTEAVARAAPDGNTLLIVANNFVTDPHLRKVNFDSLTSFEPICYLVNAPTIIVVNSTSPYRTLADLFDAARAKPGELTMASVGPGSPFQVGFEILKRAAKVDMTFVPYPGNAPAVNALLGGHVTSMFGSYSNVTAHLSAGKLRALAVGMPKRAEPLPDVPTVAESGYKDFAVDAWFGAFAPAKIPKEIVSRLANWFTAAMQVPEVKAKLVAQELYPVGTCGSDFAIYVREQYEYFGRVIRDSNIKAE
jgi:tripartite-type tricarboxylate transporter receptor subunit TctC